jgi:CRISPR-associated protein Csh1
MIQEITNYINALEKNKPEIFSNQEIKDGLYFMLDFEAVESRVQQDVYPNEGDLSEVLKEWQKVQGYMKPVSNNKSFNSSKKVFIGSANGFALVFKKKNYANKTWEVLIPIVESYFKSAYEYAEKKQHIEWIEELETFCLNEMHPLLQSNEAFNEGKQDLMIHFFLKMPAPSEYQKLYEVYLEKNLFNSPQSSIEIDEKMLGISDDLNTFNDKKIFLRHKTAPFEYNFRTNGDVVKAVWKFFQIKAQNKGKGLPNPIPIFIDYEELNEKVVEIYREDRNYSYSEILKKIFETSSRKQDLGNYYLLFYYRRNLVDMDFVPNFNYSMSMKIQSLFKLGEKSITSINNVFDFEREIVSQLFDSLLVSNFENSFRVRYFTDYDAKKKDDSDAGFIREMLNKRTKNFNSIAVRTRKFRKAFYDYIYKSKSEAITYSQIKEIIFGGIMDDIRLDKHEDNKNSNGYDIKSKLNIYFSLANFDFQNHHHIKTLDMPSRINQHREMIKRLAKGEISLKNDEEFAFTVGQVIYRIFQQSETGDKSYSRLEPFLQKVKCKDLQMAITNFFNAYKHKEYSVNFHKPFAEVCDYQMDNDSKLKELMPIILAGFFSENELYSDETIEKRNN